MRLRGLLLRTCWRCKLKLNNFYCQSNFIEPKFLDHCACIIEFGQPFHQQAGPFKFFNFLVKHGEFLNTVRLTWSTVGLQGCKMFKLTQKLKSLKVILRKLNRDDFNNIQGRVAEAKEMLSQLQLKTLETH